MLKASRVNIDSSHWLGDSVVYWLDEPYQGYQRVVVTILNDPGQWQGKGVEVFPCDEHGAAIAIDGGLRALWQSYVIMTHEEILAVLGYKEEV